MMPLYRQITIIGPGLLGGSLALACRGRGLAGTVVGAARRQETVELGLRMGAFDRATLDLADAVEDAELVVLAAPVRSSIRLMEAIQPVLPAGALVTDVGSTKAIILRAAARVLGAGRFIGGHPMAGSHRSGIGAAREDLFAGCRYLLTADDSVHPDDRERMELLVKGLGAVPMWLNASAHDRLVARISHLPHLAACALVECAERYSVSGVEALALASTGFRDTTRIAAGDAGMWTDICLTNGPAILDGLEAYIASLIRLRTRLQRESGEELQAWLEDTGAARRRISSSPPVSAGPGASAGSGASVGSGASAAGTASLENHA